MRHVYLVLILLLCGVIVLGCGKDKQQPPATAGEETATTKSVEKAGSAEKAESQEPASAEKSGGTGSAEKTESMEATAPAEAGSATKEPESKYPKEYIGKDGAKMALIPEGAFQMGNANGDRDESPVHPVQLDAFYMDIYEVTNAQYKKFVDATGHPVPRSWDDAALNGPNQPVVWVSWDDAVAYAEWAGERLPTEAEWEYAARGGLSGKLYPWGNELPGAGGEFRANYYPLGGKSDGYDKTAPVGSFPPNKYGLYDMAGNVWELCADWYYEHWYGYEKQVLNPQGPTDEYAKSNGYVRVRRGGAWSRRGKDLTCANRGNQQPGNGDDKTGFRCVISAKDVVP